MKIAHSLITVQEIYTVLYCVSQFTVLVKKLILFLLTQELQYRCFYFYSKVLGTGSCDVNVFTLRNLKDLSQ